MRSQPQEVIAKLEADNSRLAKEAVLQEAMEEGLDEFFEGVRMALDPLVTFGVKQVPEKDEVISAQGCEWKIFKELADKLGVVLNESVLDAHSSMALSIYSPTNLAELLTDEVEQTRDEKIAIAKKLLAEQQNSLN